MLKINNHTIYKYKVPLSLLLIACCSLTLFSYLTSIPTYSSAADTTADQRTLMNIKYMQQMSEQICTNTKENKTKQLIDIRDGKSYWVTKLKDGNCWMTQNLDYDITIKDNPNIKKRTYNGTDKCTGWEADYNVAQYCDPGEIDAGHNSRGNYYSWVAAINGANDEQSTIIHGICPDIWHLPSKNGANGSFDELMSAYKITNSSDGAQAMLSEPLYFLLSGRVDRNDNQLGEVNCVNGNGYWWSSTPNYTTEAYTPNLSSGNIAVMGYARAFGMSVRCVTSSIEKTLDGNGNTDESLWPDSNYPDDPDLNPVSPDEKYANLAITVSPVISIDATSGMSSAVDFTTVALGDIKATVSSNQAYQVLLSTNQSTLEQEPSVVNQNIPMVEQDTPITAGTRAWGIKKTNSVLPNGTLGDSSTNTNLTYSPIGINDDKVLFYQSQGAESKTLIFPVAISVDSTLPSGTYATDVTITTVGN